MSDENELEARREARAARQNDPQRSRTAGRAFPELPSRTVPCMDCGAPTELSGFAWEFAKAASRERLLPRGEQPLRNNELTRCAPCGVAWNRAELERYETLCATVNAAQHRANTAGFVDRALITLLRDEGRWEWAEGIEEGARKHAEANAKQRGGRKAAAGADL